ncbi:MAG: peroxide stress protein YaaA [Desulforhopalus sp.]
MQIITAPSKTQKFNGRTYAQYTYPVLLDKTKILADQLKLMNRDELSRLLKTSERLTESTYQLIESFTLPFDPDNSKQVLFTFQGDAYSAIDADLYSTEQLHHAQQHLFILSGFYGILRPLDLMQPYRLELGSVLTVGKDQNLYQFWGDQITEIINQALMKSKDKILINLASKEYSKVINKKKLQGEMIDITFRQMHKGRLKTIPIYSKRARGTMIHFAISEQIVTAEGLKEFDKGGYNFSSENSTATEWTFFKKD